jgi:hypothetical protein
VEERIARYGPWFAGAQHLHFLFKEVKQLSLIIIERTESWTRNSP